MTDKKEGKLKKSIVLVVDKELWSSMRMVCVEQEKTMTEVVRALMKKYVESHRKILDKYK